MAFSKLMIWLLLLTLIILKISANSEIVEETATPEGPDPSLIHELEQLKSKISVLESNIEDRTRELRSKDEMILRLEKVAQLKSDSLLALQKELESIQKKGTVDVEEQIGRAHARAGELEKQVEELKNEVEMQNKKRDVLELRASQAENKLMELNAKLDTLQKVSGEQKNWVHKAERALKAAEEKLMKAQLEASSRAKELMEVHGAWLPPWLATHLVQLQAFGFTNWNKYGKPTVDVAVQKAGETSVKVQKWIEPHVETVNSRWVPILKELWMTFTTSVGPYVQIASARAVELYEVSKSTVEPLIVKVKKVADPYLQEAKKFTKPYVDQAATVAKPHVEKVRVVMKPYTKHVVYAYGKFLKSATMYHHQVQAKVQKQLKKHELTKAIATKELVWFLASALLALPIFTLYRVYSACFCKKARKPIRNGHNSHAHRRPKRRHAEK